MRPTLVSFTLLTTLWSATAAASADAHEQRFPIDIAEIEARALSHFNTVDTDQSGSVDLAEFEAAEAPDMRKKRHHRQRRHAGQSGHPGGHGPRQQRRQQMHDAVEAEMFAILDADGDGAVSEAEFAAGNTREARKLARKRAMFKRLDTDQDNLLTAEEFPNPGRRLRAADADGDGLVSKQEMHDQWRERRQAYRDKQAG